MSSSRASSAATNRAPSNFPSTRTTSAGAAAAAGSAQNADDSATGPGNVNDPLSIFLLKNGSKGDKLLFRYPIPAQRDDDRDQTRKTKRNPYAVSATEDMYQNMPLVSSSIENGTIRGFDDKVLSNLFSAKNSLCGKRLEVKINDVRFISHPTLPQPSPEMVPYRRFTSSSSFNLFNVVIALRARASHWVVENYHELCRRLSIALRNEEFRCGYLTKETKIMQDIDDQLAAEPESSTRSVHELILEKSRLATELRDIFVSMCETGVVQLRLNKWIDVSFCLPQKVHYLQNCQLVIEPSDIFKCLESIFPYHGLLLLNQLSSSMWQGGSCGGAGGGGGVADDAVSLNSTSASVSAFAAATELEEQRDNRPRGEQWEAERIYGEPLPLGASPALYRLLRVTSPVKSIQQLAGDADLTVNMVFQFCCQLVYWGKALIIYPLCETNVYILTPGAPVHSPALQEEFSETFPGLSLIDAAAEFSLPTSLSQKQNPVWLSQNQRKEVQIVVWLLQKRLLMQLHIYVYFLPPGRPRKPRASSLRRSSFAMTSRSRQSTPDNELWFYAGDDLGTDIAEEDEEDEEEDEGKRQRAKEALEAARSLLPELRGWELRAILKCPASQDLEDLKLFAALFPYFNGMHHLEEIMFCANVQRSTLIQLTEKFQGVLLTCQHEDPRLSAFYQHSATPSVSAS